MHDVLDVMNGTGIDFCPVCCSDKLTPVSEEQEVFVAPDPDFRVDPWEPTMADWEQNDA